MPGSFLNSAWRRLCRCRYAQQCSAACRPFLLQAKASYTAIGVFSLAAYPYSFKLAWSPIVDSVYSLALGRRKSWVVPIQLASAASLLLSANWADARLQVGRLGMV